MEDDDESIHVHQNRGEDLLESSKEPRPQGGALKHKFSKPETEIPKSKTLILK